MAILVAAFADLWSYWSIAIERRKICIVQCLSRFNSYVTLQLKKLRMEGIGKFDVAQGIADSAVVVVQN
jgi:hypothetical protein